MGLSAQLLPEILNFLSHYLLDASLSPWFNLGLALPDLTGVAERGFRPAWPPESEKDINESELAAGWRAHVAADAVFHNSDAFLHYTKEIRKRLKLSGMNSDGRKLFFMAHVLFEIMLDRQIVIHRPETAVDFYLDLEKIEVRKMCTILRREGLQDAEKLSDIFTHFVQAQWLYQYADADGVFRSMNRMLIRGGQKPMTPAESAGFFEVVDWCDGALWPSLDTMFSSWRAAVNERRAAGNKINSSA